MSEKTKNEEALNSAPRQPAGAPAGGLRRRGTYAVLILAFLFVLMPFLFWQATWFGRPLSEEEMEKNLADREHPRKTQHALSQIADRILERDPTVRRWYPQVVALAAHQTDEIRLTAAWVMGQDNSVAEFRAALLRLVEDPHPMVRRNAALSLVRFGDATGRPEILAMLRSFQVTAPQKGTLVQRLKVGDTLSPGTLLGRIQVGEEELEIRSLVPGTLERWLVPDGAAINAGDAIVLLAPSPEMVWEALRALVLVGTLEDLPDVDRYTLPVDGMPDVVRQQAQLAARAIRSRTQE